MLAGSIVPSYYLGSFFEFIYDIYKLNFDNDLPQDLYEEFQFVYDGLQNAMHSDSDDVQVNVTKKTYKLIKSTKLLITNPMYNDVVIKLSIIVVRLIDKYIWGKEVDLYNPYLKRGCEQWLASMKKEKEYGERKKVEQFRSRWEPEYVLNGNVVSLMPPVHRVKSFYDYRDIRVVVKNGAKIIYEERVTDIREIIGGFQVKNDPIELYDPLGNIVYQLVAGNSVIYDSKTRLYRDFIVFDEQGCELTNNRDYSGTAVFCTRTLTDTNHSYFDSDNYHLSFYNARLGDTIFIDNTVFNFSEMIRPGIFGEKYEGCFIALENSKIEVFKKDVILIYESEYTEGRFEIQINHISHKMQEFEYSITERKGVNKYTVKLDDLNPGIYEIKVYALNNGKRLNILQTRFAIDKTLQIEQVEESGDMYVVSISSDLIEQSIIEEIDLRKFKEDWLKFKWNGITYTYYVPLCFKLYRIDGSEWVPFSEEIWIGDIAQDSVIDIYGQKYDGMCILTSAGKTTEETPAVKDEGVFCRIPAGYLLSYKTNYDFVDILLSINGRFSDDILCYNKCVLDENKTLVNYSHEDKALIVTPYFHGKGNIRFKIVDDSKNTVYTCSHLEKGEQEYVFDLTSFVNYKVIFFEKERGLSLKRERLLKEFQIVFYDREDFVGKSFKIKEVYFDQSVRGEFLRKKHYFNKTYIYFKEMLSGNTYTGEVYARTYNGVFMLDNINPVDIEICSDVIDGLIELSITKDGDGLLLDFEHHGIMNSMDDDKAVDIYSYSIDMKGVESA